MSEQENTSNALPSGTYNVTFHANGGTALNPTLCNPGGPALIPGATSMYVGDVPWQYIPPPAPWQAPAYPVQMVPSTTLTEDDIRALVAKWLREDPEIRAILSGAVDEHLDELACELNENKAFQPTRSER